MSTRFRLSSLIGLGTETQKGKFCSSYPVLPYDLEVRRSLVEVGVSNSVISGNFKAHEDNSGK